MAITEQQDKVAHFMTQPSDRTYSGDGGGNTTTTVPKNLETNKTVYINFINENWTGGSTTEGLSLYIDDDINISDDVSPYRDQDGSYFKTYSSANVNDTKINLYTDTNTERFVKDDTIIESGAYLVITIQETYINNKFSSAKLISIAINKVLEKPKYIMLYVDFEQAYPPYGNIYNDNNETGSNNDGDPEGRYGLIQPQYKDLVKENRKSITAGINISVENYKNPKATFRGTVPLYYEDLSDIESLNNEGILNKIFESEIYIQLLTRDAGKLKYKYEDKDGVQNKEILDCPYEVVWYISSKDQIYDYVLNRQNINTYGYVYSLLNPFLPSTLEDSDKPLDYIYPKSEGAWFSLDNNYNNYLNGNSTTTSSYPHLFKILDFWEQYAMPRDWQHTQLIKAGKYRFEDTSKDTNDNQDTTNNSTQNDETITIQNPKKGGRLILWELNHNQMLVNPKYFYTDEDVLITKTCFRNRWSDTLINYYLTKYPKFNVNNNDVVGVIQYFPESGTTSSLKMVQLSDVIESVDYLDEQSNFVTCEDAKIYTMASEDSNLNTIYERGISLNYNLQHLSNYIVVGEKKNAGKKFVPIVTTSDQLSQYNLSSTNLQSKKDLFNNAAGICVYDKVGENTKLHVAINEKVNTTNTRDEGTFSWEDYKNKLENVANEDVLQNKPLYLMPTFFYYTDADKDAKTNANINNQTVNFNYGKNINNQTTDCSVGIGVLDGESPKLVQPGAKYASASADYWASLYLGMLTQLYISTNDSNLSILRPTNYAYLSANYTKFNQDILLQIYPRIDVENHNGLLNLGGINYQTYLDQISLFNDETDPKNTDVNVKVVGVLKNFPINFTIDYKLPNNIIKVEEEQRTAAVERITGDIVEASIEEESVDKDIYVLNHEGKLVKFQEYPYVAKADLNGWSVENGKIKFNKYYYKTLMDCSYLSDKITRKTDANTNTIIICYNDKSFTNDTDKYKVLLTEYRKNWGKKRELYMTDLPANVIPFDNVD